MILRQAVTADPVFEFAAEVRAGLLCDGQKELPSKYLYDDVGSALFEVISALPEYGLTRADQRLLRENAAEIVARVNSQYASACGGGRVAPAAVADANNVGRFLAAVGATALEAPAVRDVERACSVAFSLQIGARPTPRESQGPGAARGM